MEEAVTDIGCTFDSYFLDEYGNLIFTLFIDLRDNSRGGPINTLIKGSREEHAIENCERVRISKLEHFREQGENLIQDPLEGEATDTSHIEETDTDPLLLPEVQALIEAVESSSEESGVKMEIKSLSSSISQSLKQTTTYGRNVWIFSASIEPSGEGEWDRWWKSLPKDYSHVSYIFRPRSFARALSAMVAEQIGPRGKEEQFETTFLGLTLVNSGMSQVVMHGPVIYVRNPDEVILNASDDAGSLLRLLFIKGLDYQDQREYRFVVFAEEEPEEKVVYLNASMALLGSLRERLYTEAAG